MKKFTLFFIILLIILGLIPVLSVKAAAPTGTLTGTVITVDIGQIKAINTITVTDHAVTPEITTANDICIRLQSTTNANWDVADTTPTFGGTASAKVAAAVTYPAVQTLKIDVTTNFAAGDTLTIAALSYVGHTGASAGAALQWAIDNTTCASATFGTGNANTAVTVADGAEDTLTSVTAVAANSQSSARTSYTINFTVPTDGVITKNGKIKITFPGGFNVAESAAGTLTGIDGTVALTLNGQQVILTRQNDGTNSTAGAKSAVLNTIDNAGGQGSYTVTVRTDTAADNLLATATSSSFTSSGGGGGGGGGGGIMYTNVPPSTMIDNPNQGAILVAGQPYTIKGTARDDGGFVVNKVEVSLDGGNTWEIAQITQITGITGMIENVVSWQYAWQNPTKGSWTIKARSTDTVGNIELSYPSVNVAVSSISPSPPEDPRITELKTTINLLQQIIQLIKQLILLQTEIARFSGR